MNQSVAELLERLLVALDQVDIKPGGEFPAVIECMQHCAAAVRDLESRLENFTFENQAEEIHFFKVLKPQLEGRLLYYMKLSAILQLSPTADYQERRAYLKGHLAQIEQFYREHAELHLYYRLEHSYLDQLYFTRQAAGALPALGGQVIALDRRLHSPKSHLFSHFFANGLLSTFLNSLINDENWDPARREGDRLVWTASQAAAVELLYALNEAGAFNHKKQDVKRLADQFGRAFGFRIANAYATHDDNRMRKKDRTQFLSSLLRLLNAKYDYDDLHAL